MKIQIDLHTLERAEERGAKENEMNLSAASCRVSKTSIRNIYVLHPVASHRELSS